MDEGYEEHVYYVRHSPGQPPVATVAVCRTPDGTYFRGIAICSPDEMFCRRKGRKAALGRMHRAIGLFRNREAGLPTQYDPIGEEIPVLGYRSAGPFLKSVWKFLFGSDIHFKTEAGAVLTNFEEQLFRLRPRGNNGCS